MSDAEGVLAISLDGSRLEPRRGNFGRASSARYEVLFSGELTNRNTLGTAGEPRGDAELVLNEYERNHIVAPGRLRGEYLFAARDRERNVCFLVRDQMGMRPCFYAVCGHEILASASTSSLLDEPGVSRSLDRLTIANHLCHRWPDPQATYFEAVRRLGPAHALTAKSGNLEVHRYWHPDPSGSDLNWATADETAAFSTLLEQSVARCLGTHSGIFLSGGLDSVSVALFATEVSNRTGRTPPAALSLGFPDGASNEEEVQRRVAATLSLPLDYMTFDEATNGGRPLELSLDLVGQWPVPMLNIWNGAYDSLARRGRERGCEVILTGMGGDEWLTVSPFVAADALREFNARAVVDQIRTLRNSYPMSLPSIIYGTLWRFGLRPMIGAALDQVAPERWRSMRTRRQLRADPEWVAPDPTLRTAMRESVAQNLSDSDPPDGFYRRECRTALEHAIVSMEMEENFELGRRHGVKMRHPFWDVDLLELLVRIPPRLLSQHGRSKGLVRDTIAQRFPGFGFEGQKKVLSTDFFRDMLAKDGPAAWKKSGGALELARLGIVQPTMLESEMADLFRGSDRYRLHRVWDVLMLERWVRSRLHGV